MAWKRWLIVFCVGAVWGVQTAPAADLKINLPRRSKLTPVQRLNREGVEAIRKNKWFRRVKIKQSRLSRDCFEFVYVILITCLWSGLDRCWLFLRW